MSQCGASWWTALAVTLTWRLARTGDALRDGLIDLSRARLIAEATSVLDDDAARLVEEKVLPRAGDQTLGQLRAALRRAVIIADPDGAERRREEAERRARVCLYPDEEGTATLAGHSLPGIHAAAAMARVTALARAVRASGAGGGIDLLRAQVFTGLLLGTLPYIPPAPGSPPDEPPDDDGGIDPHPASPRTTAHRATGHGPAGRGPAGDGPAGRGPAGGGGAGQDGAAPRRPPPDSGSAGRAGGRAASPPRSPQRGQRGPEPTAGSSGVGSGRARPGPPPAGSPGPVPGHGPAPGPDPGSLPGPGPGPAAGIGWPSGCGPSAGPDLAPSSGSSGGTGRASSLDPYEGTGTDPPDPGPDSNPELPPDPGYGGPWAGFPDPEDCDAPEDCGAPEDCSAPEDSYAAGNSRRAEDELTSRAFARDDDGDDMDRGSSGRPAPRWPAVPAVAGLRSGPGSPAAGLLDLAVPFAALAGFSSEPGRLSRLGPVTARQAARLAALAAGDPEVCWRVILVRTDGSALGVARVPGRRPARRPDAGGGNGTGGGTGGRCDNGGSSGDGGVGGGSGGGGGRGEPHDRGVPPACCGLVARVTVTVPEDLPGQAGLLRPGGGQLPGAGIRPGRTLAALMEAALRAAEGIAARVAQDESADAEAGGCAHRRASPGYRPSPGLREYVTIRDLTCRFSTCRQPAMRGDLDHTIPWDKGGLTCSCNLGGVCRHHHRLKQRRGWQLAQSAPGVFTWVTPAGRTYTTQPDLHH